MYEQLQKKLLSYDKKTISLSELEEMTSDQHLEHEEMEKPIESLEHAGYIEKMEMREGNSTHCQYVINRNRLIQTSRQLIKSNQNRLHSSIELDAYFELDAETFERDLPYLEKISTYIEQNDFPQDVAPPEVRSLELVQNKKWITEENGAELLDRIGLWGKMKIGRNSDPLMFAVHPQRVQHNFQFHLVVEDQAVYEALLPVLEQTDFSTLIYGNGKGIIESIGNFSKQFPVEARHVFFYFGNISQTGIEIWHEVNKRQKMIPALPFYQACLNEKVEERANQLSNEQAIKKFLSYFNENEQVNIRALLSNGGVYPQEIMETEEFQEIWTETSWCTLG